MTKPEKTLVKAFTQDVIRQSLYREKRVYLDPVISVIIGNCDKRIL